MKDIKNTIVTLIITSVFTFILSIGAEILSQPKGKIVLGPVSNIGNVQYTTLDIYNYKDEPINNILLTLPISLSQQTIKTSNIIQITIITNTIQPSNIHRVSISGVSPNILTRITLPLANIDEINNIEIINSNDLNIVFEKSSQTISPTSELVKNALTNTIIYFFIFGLFLIYYERYSNKLRENLANLNNDLTKATNGFEMQSKKRSEDFEKRESILQQKINEITNQNKSLQKSIKRQNVYLIRLISDYRKELDFWHDSLRGALYRSGATKNGVQNIFDAVTKSLQTYGTRSKKASDYETINLLAGLVAEGKSLEKETLD